MANCNLCNLFSPYIGSFLFSELFLLLNFSIVWANLSLTRLWALSVVSIGNLYPHKNSGLIQQLNKMKSIGICKSQYSSQPIPNLEKRERLQWLRASVKKLVTFHELMKMHNNSDWFPNNPQLIKTLLF